jgi:hypothetical protein
LIQVKASIEARRHALSLSQEFSHMPTESLLVTVCVVAMFAVFAGVLFWGDLQTRPKHLANSSNAKRRAF